MNRYFIAVLAVLTMSLAACTSTTSGTQVTPPGGSGSSTSVTATDSPTATAIATTPPASESSTASAPATTPSSGAATSGRAALPKGTCTGSQLTVRVLRGGAIPGREIALVTFTNISATPCTMFGFPGVSLRLQNSLLAQPAERTSDNPTSVRLAPGEHAQAQLTDNSSCQAPLSDTVRVYPPNLITFVDVTPFQLRGCTLRVAPVTHS
ncbi:MAG: DUF4232 domain-containing protein [Actinomycetota bacterium]|nr:DUF4232 domain-containing protein [Actinomycetota bacterium]